jgi:thiosulfate dehydrogenase [quinone] large subunit
MYISGRYLGFVGLGRIVIGIIFLWAGLEKVLGSGAAGFDASGFLKFGTAGTVGWPFVTGDVAQGTIFNPTHDFWTGLAANDAAMSIINILVPYGQIGIGVSLILGLFTRFGAAMGTLMMIFFFFAAWDFEFGIVNQHLTYAVVTFGLAVIGAGNYFGLDAIVGPRAGPFIRRWICSGDTAPPGAAPSSVMA